MNRRLLSALCFVMLAANAMGEEPVTFPDVEWEVRTPAEVGPGRTSTQWMRGYQRLPRRKLPGSVLDE